MMFRSLIAGALALALSASAATAQTNQGSSPLSIAKGGTSAATASAARAALGLTIGSAVQAWDADLDALAALSGTDTIYRRSGAATWSAVTIGGLLSFSAGTLNIGDAELVALAGLTSAADKCAYFTGSGTAALTDCPSFGRSLMNAADAATARSTLGVSIGSAVQAWDADLDALAALSGTNTIYYRSASNTWTAVTIGGLLSFSGGTLNVGDAELTAIAGLTSAADKCAYFTGSGTAALMDCGSAVRTFHTTPSSANLAAWLSDETGSGAAVFGTSPTIGGLLNISGAFKYTGTASPSQITSNQNDYNPSSVNCATASTLLINSDAARDITGLAGGASGCVIILVNNGSQTITLKEQSGSSSAANRFNTGGDVLLVPAGAVTLLYEAGSVNRWRLTALVSSGAGSGTVTSAVIAAGNGAAVAGTCTITTSGTCTVSLNAALGQGLIVKNGSNLELQRYNGRHIFINGAIEVIPSSAPTLAAPATSGTLYYIYVYMSGGTMTLEASTTAYATDSTYGHKIKSGDATRSLVGMARTVSSAWVDSATQRFVRSWFNEIAKPALAQNANNGAVSTNTRVEIDSTKRLEFLLWAGEKISVSISTNSAFSTSTPHSQDFDVGFDATTAEAPVRIRIVEANIAYGGATSVIKDGLSEGYHYATGTCTYVAGAANSGITANTVWLRGQIQ